MLRILMMIIALLPGAAAGQETCRWFSDDGLSVTMNEDDLGAFILIYSNAHPALRCGLRKGEARSVMIYICPDWTGDLILVPLEPFGPFPDIIVLPPNILYWKCAVPT